MGYRMTQPQEKRREWAHVNRFRENFSGFPHGQIKKQECPDFFVETEQGITGIEHTESFQDESKEGGSPMKAQETLQQKVLWNAVRLYETRGLPYLDVMVNWNEHATLNARRAKELQTVLTDLVASHVPDPNEVAEIQWPDRRWQSLPPEIDSIRIARFDYLSQNHWNFLRSGYIPTLDPHHIEQIIRQKESKLTSYCQKCSTVWLLIVADEFHPSSFCEISNEVLHYEFETAFDRLFFFKYFDGIVIELKRRRRRDER